MKLEKERKLNYKVSIEKDYPELQNLTIEYNAIDNSKIYAEIVVKKTKTKDPRANRFNLRFVS